MILQLVVDDGVANRGHRHNIYSPDFAYTGLATATHPTFKMCCVIDYAASVGEKGKREEIKAGGVDIKGSMDQSIEDFKTGKDPHRPPNTVHSKISVSSSVRGTKVTKTITKVYTLKDGSTKTVKLTETSG